MANLLNSLLLVVLTLNIVYGFLVYAVPYDHSYTHECLAKPLKPQYNGGIVLNPELNVGLKGRTTLGEAKIQSQDSNKYILGSNRKQSSHSFTQKFNLEKEKLYTFSAWLQVSHGNADIAAVFKTQNSNETAGWITAKEGCWSMLKGGLVVNASGPAELHFQSNNTEVDIWADSISLQPFTQEEWRFHQDQNIEKIRKRWVKIQAVDDQGRPLSNATISIQQKRPRFPLGCAINQNILNNGAYQRWWSSRFKYTVFENELKWYSNEGSRGSESYYTSDALVRFAKSKGAQVRGHNVFWDDPKYQPSWVPGLSTNDLWAAANKRIYSVVSRYRGQLFHWDVVNENLHFGFLESKLGYSASTTFYQKANQIDPRATPFLNDYNTIEDNRDGASSPSKYLQKIKQLRSQGYRGPLGIGLEGHFSFVNLPYVRSSIDMLSSARLPIWVTELDVAPGPNQANYLGQILQELQSHPTVQGVILWAAWSPQGCYRMCLTDNNFRNLATGNVVDRFRAVLTHEGGVQGTTDSNGYFEASLYHGDYEAVVSHPMGNKSSNLHKFSVLPYEEEARDSLHIKIAV